MDVTDDGSDTSSSAASPLQAESGTLASPSGEGGPPGGAARQGAAAAVSLAELRPAEGDLRDAGGASRMYPPMDVTPSGSERDASAVQPLKAWPPMDVTDDGRTRWMRARCSPRRRSRLWT